MKTTTTIQEQTEKTLTRAEALSNLTEKWEDRDKTEDFSPYIQKEIIGEEERWIISSGDDLLSKYSFKDKKTAEKYMRETPAITAMIIFKALNEN